MANVVLRKFHPKKECADSDCGRAYKIVEYAHDSCEALYDAFHKLKGGRPGAATDEEQDVLRAMLVSAGSGIDATIKQLFRDALQPLLLVDSDVKEGFEKFTEKALRRTAIDPEYDSRFLAKALTTPLPLFHIAERYVYELTGSSLQSADQLFAAYSALGIEPVKVGKLNKNDLKDIFDTRNKIVHELDIDFTGARRNRVQRRIERMTSMSNTLLKTSQEIVEHVHERLPPTPPVEG